jgi:hypothetical protein
MTTKLIFKINGKIDEEKYNYVTVKHINGSIKETYAFYKLMTFNDMYKEFNDIIITDFGLENFDIIPLSNKKEKGVELFKLEKIKKYMNKPDISKFINKYFAFYVRPKNEDTNDECEADDTCPVCFTLNQNDTNRYFNCSHQICGRCFIQWRKSKSSNVSCPLCRAE